jgi:dimethylhistidine N-methyltransferase
MTAVPKFIFENTFAHDVLIGLSAERKMLPAKYFYDVEGSNLFDKICLLQEYYPTRTECEILGRAASEISGFIGKGKTLVELGAGSLKKIEILFANVPGISAYVPVDISGEFLKNCAGFLSSRWPHLTIKPVIADFTSEFVWEGDPDCSIGFFPGSTIGNMHPSEARSFLANVRKRFKALIIGVDVVKDPAVLHAAYNDEKGVTAAFNKNILARINRELGADFDLGAFAHYAFYNPPERRIEMHLMSNRCQSLSLLGRSIQILEGETIHTENSYKYTVDGFQELAMSAGFIPNRVWLDSEKNFSIHWLDA